ncbi:helix-turn-helix domain-containing protein [Nocardioides panzhihuensis]|uniref:Excisionase family DNA binding protein n=1 Tax=Nocardioides panzhihuensis TaxID=860243 RepID=A0A7Z0DNX0_9ACTN|nr:helix-turn-helix domain-containing protein [Nocardioides panzhihuensis]NYI78702.1 excisionase family DNA binding protein [Nocardioides panzhihuensis]
MRTPISDPWLTLTHGAEYADAHPETLRRAIRRGDLAAARFNRNLRIRQSAIDAWMTGDQPEPSDEVA